MGNLFIIEYKPATESVMSTTGNHGSCLCVIEEIFGWQPSFEDVMTEFLTGFLPYPRVIGLWRDWLCAFLFGHIRESVMVLFCLRAAGRGDD